MVGKRRRGGVVARGRGGRGAGERVARARRDAGLRGTVVDKARLRFRNGNHFVPTAGFDFLGAFDLVRIGEDDVLGADFDAEGLLRGRGVLVVEGVLAVDDRFPGDECADAFRRKRHPDADVVAAVDCPVVVVRERASRAGVAAAEEAVLAGVARPVVLDLRDVGGGHAFRCNHVDADPRGDPIAAEGGIDRAVRDREVRVGSGVAVHRRARGDGHHRPGVVHELRGVGGVVRDGRGDVGQPAGKEESFLLRVGGRGRGGLAVGNDRRGEGRAFGDEGDRARGLDRVLAALGDGGRGETFAREFHRNLFVEPAAVDGNRGVRIAVDLQRAGEDAGFDGHRSGFFRENGIVRRFDDRSVSRDGDGRAIRPDADALEVHDHVGKLGVAPGDDGAAAVGGIRKAVAGDGRPVDRAGAAADFDGLLEVVVVPALVFGIRRDGAAGDGEFAAADADGRPVELVDVHVLDGERAVVGGRRLDQGVAELVEIVRVAELRERQVLEGDVAALDEEPADVAAFRAVEFDVGGGRVGRHVGNGGVARSLDRVAVAVDDEVLVVDEDAAFGEGDFVVREELHRRVRFRGVCDGFAQGGVGADLFLGDAALAVVVGDEHAGDGRDAIVVHRLVRRVRVHRRNGFGRPPGERVNLAVFGVRRRIPRDVQAGSMVVFAFGHPVVPCEGDGVSVNRHRRAARVQRVVVRHDTGGNLVRRRRLVGTGDVVALDRRVGHVDRRTRLDRVERRPVLTGRPDQRHPVGFRTHRRVRHRRHRQRHDVPRPVGHEFDVFRHRRREVVFFAPQHPVLEAPARVFRRFRLRRRCALRDLLRFGRFALVGRERHRHRLVHHVRPAFQHRHVALVHEAHRPGRRRVVAQRRVHLRERPARDRDQAPALGVRLVEGHARPFRLVPVRNRRRVRIRPAFNGQRGPRERIGAGAAFAVHRHLEVRQRRVRPAPHRDRVHPVRGDGRVVLRAVDDAVRDDNATALHVERAAVATRPFTRDRVAAQVNRQRVPRAGGHVHTRIERHVIQQADRVTVLRRANRLRQRRVVVRLCPVGGNPRRNRTGNRERAGHVAHCVVALRRVARRRDGIGPDGLACGASERVGHRVGAKQSRNRRRQLRIRVPRHLRQVVGRDRDCRRGDREVRIRDGKHRFDSSVIIAEVTGA